MQPSYFHDSLTIVSCFSKPSRKGLHQSVSHSTKQCIVRSSYVVRPCRYIVFNMTYIGDQNDSVNKAIFILHSLCIFGSQMMIISAGLVYPLNVMLVLKGGYNMLTQCKSFADAFIIQTCGNNKQLDYSTPRSTNCACSAVFKQNRFNSA